MLDSSTLQKQLELEEAALTASFSKAQKLLHAATSRGEIDRLPEGQILLSLSITRVSQKLEELFNDRPRITRFLAEYRDHFDTLAYVIVITLLRELTREPFLRGPRAIKAVSQAVVHNLGEIRLQQRTDNLQEYIKRRYKSWSRKRLKEERVKIIEHLGLMRKGDLNSPQVARLASYLIDAVIASGANIIEKKTVSDGRNKLKAGFIMTEEAVAIVAKSRSWFTQNLLSAPIFVLPPKPWETFKDTGGYYTERPKDDLRASFEFTAIKPNRRANLNTSELLGKYLDANPHTRDATLGGLNKLSQTAWKVNTRVLEVMDYVFTNSIQDPTAPATAPRLVGKLPVFEKLEAEDFVKPSDIGGVEQPDGSYTFPESSRGWRDYYILRDAVIDNIESNSARALSLAMALNIAHNYKDYDNLYFTYQYDYRGRVYPIQAHLNPIGPDPVKALLQFAKGRTINSGEALKWFMIHGANCFGYDKEPFDVRVSKITEMRSEIVKIADDPMLTRDIWGDADSPWQFLAWCFEYAAYLKDSSYPVSIAVALDASCSGIQIYSGLLRDAEGAQATNVIGDTRSDLYQQVADKVNEMLVNGDYPSEITFNQTDGSSHTASSKPIADSLKGHITRSLVKQPVMTTPYAVSDRGIKEQLLGRLKELENENGKFWIGENWKVALFLAPLIQKAIGEAVKGASVGQGYLQRFAKDIGRTRKYIFYTSPLTGFPVILSTAQVKKKRLNTIIGMFTISTNSGDLDIRKLSQGIAPNYVHSLDSALLMTVVNRLNDAGITDYHLIHDSYGVHPNDTTTFNRIVRESYVDIFRTNPLQSFVTQAWPDYKHPPQDVMINTLDLDRVMTSKYIFS